MKNSLSIIGGIIIIVAVAWFAMRGDSDDAIVPAPTATPTVAPSVGGLIQLAPTDIPAVSPSPEASVAPAAVTVSIDDEGFTPATVTVKAGTTVTFVNNGQALHWPASNPHPIHTGLSGFDARKGLATGETFSFTFTKAGTFGMHDHLNTALVGTIVVQ
ncbi:MAG: hypothetical protein A3C02_03960 [Candidatus Andersenbacteria bacterium RIFCSPHIGHO2_02_FULL_45_11]|uniref:EfeO-type cupredoxin-like domain-containing protein n=1 Tax=Candidatus Andersenbacteria bacterium RIFCSPHIGHO2_12_FULL_45_11 TaxID=1797281 RepID=A0A1G1WZC9_9BACT|nr:MAG: hypothetical protein A2805_00675 [Candidatus Andersenbacteria bacterium RIFCSPHIGHO2_01_FULL_46_36]OGY33095.1 MAG: hypothetical protein A3D99_01400 [Candidatus Andersenbacteria bacterium RIFCSPHIGHO2_12_FULL_45_11]OGY33384.1 MAG: hypothetical protein A3C02_03960 [Candidatus Andersenbacteria bacterium RIFCSPHIGHO2_02_FULL_45_11]